MKSFTSSTFFVVHLVRKSNKNLNQVKLNKIIYIIYIYTYIQCPVRLIPNEFTLQYTDPCTGSCPVLKASIKKLSANFTTVFPHNLHCVDTNCRFCCNTLLQKETLKLANMHAKYCKVTYPNFSQKYNSEKVKFDLVCRSISEINF